MFVPAPLNFNLRISIGVGVCPVYVPTNYVSTHLHASDMHSTAGSGTERKYGTKLYRNWLIN